MAEPSSPSVSLQFFEGALWSAARNLLQAALNLVALAVVARELGPQSYGVFGVAMIVISIAEMVVGGAFTESIIQRKGLHDGHVDATFWLTTGASLGAGALVAALAAPLARLAGNEQAADVLVALACLLPVTVASRVPMALLARELRFRSSSQIGALASILSCATGIVLALRGTGVWTLVAMEAVRSIVNTVGAFIAVTWRPARRGRWSHLRELSRFNAGTLATYAVGYADLLLPRLRVSHRLATQTRGPYMRATRVASELSHLLTEPLHGVSMAACARVQQARDELQRIVTGLYATSRLLVYPAYLGMAALAPALVPWIFGPKWQPAVVAIQLLMLGGLPLAHTAYNAAILFGVGRPHWMALLFGAGCLLHAALFPALAPWGLTGAAIATLGRQYGNWPLSALLVSRATGLPVRRQFDGSAPVLLSALAMASVMAALSHVLAAAAWPAAIVVLASSTIGIVTYALALRLLAPATLRKALDLMAAFARRDRMRLTALLSQPR